MSIKIKEAGLKVRELLCLQEAVNYGAISKAAEKNGMKQSNFSVQIKNLEERLGEKLLTRIHNGIRLTEAGNEIYSLACDLTNVVNKIDNTCVKTFRVAGTIRLWTSDGLGSGYISQCFSDFYLNYPNVNIEIICSLDMPKADQFDLAIVYEKQENTRLKFEAEFNLEFGLFASKTYLQKHGYPKNLKDIQLNHRLCSRTNYSSVWKKWKDILESTKNVAAMTNSSSMLLQLVKDGIGIGLLPISMASKEPDLIHLSKIKTNFSHKFWLVVRDDIKDVDKVKALTEFVKHASDRL